MNSELLTHNFFQYGGVAQLVRACGSYPQCPGFKSLHRHQRIKAKLVISYVLLRNNLILVILACPESFLRFPPMREGFLTSGNDKTSSHKTYIKMCAKSHS